MSANLYASVSELKDRLGITDSERDFALDHCLQAASRWIDRSLGTRFYTTVGTPEIRYYSATECSWQLKVDDFLAITEVATDSNGDGSYDTIWTLGTDYVYGPVNALVKGDAYRTLDKLWWTGRFYFPVYDRAVRVTSEQFGRSALADCPPGIRELALIVAQNMAIPILDTTMPGVQTYKLGNELTVTTASSDLPKAALSLLKQFQPAGGFVY